jgi:methyl-accepting chemotaxis protein
MITERMGMRSKFVLMMGVLGLVALILIGVASYVFGKKNAMDEAKSKGELIANYIFSSRKYFYDYQRPLINEVIEQDRFYPELMSEFVIASATWEIFKKNLPGYEFKQATINPLQPANTADQDEARIINAFRDKPGMKQQEGVLTRDGNEFYFLAKPIQVEAKTCLHCHGDPQDAPKDQVQIYGIKTGYYWKVGEIVGVDMVYIPIRQAMAVARQTAAVIMVMGGGILLLALLGVWVFLNARIVAPILRLHKRTEEISLGKDLDKEIDLASAEDELGALALAIDRLRISMHKMLSRR